MVDLASIRNASFSLTPTGYNPEQVDRFLGELAESGVAGIDPSSLRSASFSLTPTGYNPEEVDRFLGSIADQLAAAPAPQDAQNEPPKLAQTEPEQIEAETEHHQIEAEIEHREPETAHEPEPPAYEDEPEPIQADVVTETAAAGEPPNVHLPEPAIASRETAQLGSLADAVDRAIAALDGFLQNELRSVRDASELEIEDIHEERRRLIDEAEQVARHHIDDTKARAEQIVDEARSDGERMRNRFEKELREERERFEQARSSLIQAAERTHLADAQALSPAHEDTDERDASAAA